MRRLLTLSLLSLCSCSKLIGLDEFEYNVGAVGGSAGVGSAGGVGGSAGGVAGANGGSQNGAAGGEGGTAGTSGEGGAAGATAGGAAGAAGTGATGGVSGMGGSSGMTGAGGTGGTGPICDTTKDPKDEPCLVDEAYGIFVSGDGDDTTGDGTRAAPYGTINRGLDAAAIAGKNVYACRDHGDYFAPVNYSAEHSGVSAYGLFECATWTISDPNLRSIVSPPTDSPALTMNGLTGTTTVEGFTFVSADAKLPGESSIAAVVENSTGVTLLYDTFYSGKGAAGGTASLTPFNFPEGNLLEGNDADALGPGTAAMFTACPGGGTTVGGAGGDISPSSGESGTPLLGAGQGGDVLESTCAGGLGGGAQGANGEHGGAGLGAAINGVLQGSRWLPQAGEAGDPGGIAQGGGGGRGSASGAGGGGAAGGCGGAGGRGGLGGGASIAVLVLESTVSIYVYTFRTRDAGDGGSGSLGQEGMLGGVAGSGWQTPGGCPGGDGGKGGTGGPGGGGAGGIVIGLAWRGTQPVTNIGGMQLGHAGKPGAAVGGGNPGVNGYVATFKDLN